MKKFEKPIIDISLFDDDVLMAASGYLQSVEDPSSYSGNNTAGNGKDLNTANLFSFIW